MKGKPICTNPLASRVRKGKIGVPIIAWNDRGMDMPLYDPDRIEYATNSGYIHVSMDNGHMLPAYLAHPSMGGKFPAITLIHDWDGLTPMVRRLAGVFAQMGYFVIAPDLLNGALPKSVSETVKHVKMVGVANTQRRVKAAIDVVMHHHQCNDQEALIGLGFGGRFALEAGLENNKLEAIVAFATIPHHFLGRLKTMKQPILAIYGTEDQDTSDVMIGRLRDELAKSELGDKHKVLVIDGLERTFFNENFSAVQREKSRIALNATLDFLATHMQVASRPTPRKRY